VPTLPTTSPSPAVLALLKTQPPLLDVRAPVEFRQGKLPNSFNAPILNDAEREQVGTTYKRDGHDAAVLLGHELVSGATRTQRIEQWQKYCLENTDAQIMCWRGGQRSALAQQWLAAQGVQRERVAGGFKAVRHGSLHVLANPQKRWWLVSGRTGSAKTPLVQSLQSGIDLEGHANHRGSAFGRRLTPQPTPVTFECALASAYLRLPGENLVVEDESRTIGRIGLPQVWHEQMLQAPIALVEASFEERVEHIHKEYVAEALDEHRDAGLMPTDLLGRYEEALVRIKRRLGGARLADLTLRLQQAFAGKTDHRDWISYLLREYYDPMYDFQLQRKTARIQFRGCHADVAAFLRAKP
jgi:tRNA 2-selenouridine synthase